MKIAKSILSPGRAQDPPISLSTSLSRRLRTNGSIKGGLASPMFPTVGKKRGGGFENPEPSSPKVTCIGQVRVKTKKKVKQTRSLSRRRSGEVSFRKIEQQSHDLLKNNSTEESGSAGGIQLKPAQLHSSSSHFQQQECVPHRNQRWVHLPVTICEALRTFGAEFSCLFPCRSSCFSNNERDKGEKGNVVGREESEGSNNGGSSCGAVFARWFVSLQDCEGGKGREIELVVGGDEEKTEVRQRISMRSSRRHVFEDMEFKEEIIEVKGEGEGGEEEEKARVSICIPPKNALLLMRCRSDPMKMAALTNRFWESPAPPKDEHEDEEEEEGAEVNEDLKEVLLQTNAAKVNVEGEDQELVSAASNVEEELEKDANLVTQIGEIIDEELQNDANLAAEMHETVDEEVRKDGNLVAEMQDFGETELEEKPYNVEELEISEDLVESEEVESNLDAFEDLLGEETAGSREEYPIQWHVEPEEEGTTQMDTSFSYDNSDNESEPEEAVKEATEPLDAEVSLEEENEEKTEKSTLEEVEEIPETSSYDENKENPTTALFTSDLKDGENDHIEENDGHHDTAIKETTNAVNKELDEENKDNDKENSTTASNVLPDCLLLMMCEPKVSMEVSKETWVCSTDFIRWLPERPAKKKVNVTEETKKSVNNAGSHPPPVHPPGPPPQREVMTQQQQHVLQPPRSSCTLPAAAAVSMAAMIEQKLVNAVGYEPFVLTRCKSEPMRTAAAKLMPEACCWKNRKLEPHRNATFGGK